MTKKIYIMADAESGIISTKVLEVEKGKILKIKSSITNAFYNQKEMDCLVSDETVENDNFLEFSKELKARGYVFLS